MPRPKSIFPARPVTAISDFVPPTDEEKAAFTEKLVECFVDEIEGFGDETLHTVKGFEHELFRLVYAIRNINVPKERRVELHARLYLFKQLDASLFQEAQQLDQQIAEVMRSKQPPTTKAGMDELLTSANIPKVIFSQRHIDLTVGKVDATFKEFETALVKQNEELLEERGESASEPVEET